MKKNLEFEPDILVLRDDGGNEAEMEVLDYVTFEGKTYVVLYPADAGDDEQVIIMHCKKDEYFFVGDQRVINGVYDLFLKANFRD